MDLRDRNTLTAKATLLSSALLLCISLSFAQDIKEPDPWFTQEHEAPSSVEEPKSDDGKSTIVLKKTNPAAIAKKLKKTLDLVPEGNLSRRISLLEEIVSTVNPSERDIQLLSELKGIKQGALDAINEASQSSSPLVQGIEHLGSYSSYFTADASLLTQLLESDFSDSLSNQISSLSRRGEQVELAAIESAVNEGGLKSIFGSRLKNSMNSASSALIARRWEELARGSAKLPGEAFLVGQLLKQNDKKLGLAIELPAGADPKLTANIGRSIESAWGKSFQLADLESRAYKPEFVLKIDAEDIQISRTTEQKTISSEIPGETIEEPNPEFLKLVERYEKAASAYEAAVSTYDSLYKDYIEKLDDTEYREAQSSLKQADANLKATPPPNGPEPSPAYEAAAAQYQIAQSLANSVSAPSAIEPAKPYPHHLKILDDLYLLPSTIITSEEKSDYEYTEKELTYRFESEAPLTLTSPWLEEVQADSVVALNQKRKWTQTEGTNPRDPRATDGTYSTYEYESALNLFGLEFSSDCAQELGILLEEAKQSLTAARSDLRQSLLLLSLNAATSSTNSLALDDGELEELAAFAQNPNVSASQFRARCIAAALSKSEFAHLANEDQIAQSL